MKLRYSVFYSDFQPNSNNTDYILLSLCPKGSFIGSLKIHANTKFTGAAINEVRITAICHCGLYMITDYINAFEHPFILPSPPIPTSRNILLQNLSSQEIRINIEVYNGTINQLTQGVIDIEFEINEYTALTKLDLIFKQPLFVYSPQRLLSTQSGNAMHIYRVSDGALKFFTFINNYIDNAGIISWLAGSQGKCRVFYNQYNNLQYVFQTNTTRMPIYNPVISLLSFNGTSNFLLQNVQYDLANFTLFLKNTNNSNHILGNSGTSASAVIVNSTTSYFRSTLISKTFNINHTNFDVLCLMKNTNILSCWSNNIKATESPFTTIEDIFKFNQIGARLTTQFFSGYWNTLIVYNSPLSESERTIINSI